MRIIHLKEKGNICKDESYYKKAIMDCYPDLLDFNNYWDDIKKLFIEQGRKDAIKILRKVETSNTEFSENRTIESFTEIVIEKLKEKK